MKPDEVMTVDLSDKDIIPLGNNNAPLEPDAQVSSDKEEDERNLEGQSIPLIGSWLGVVSVEEEENKEFIRARGQATPWKLFNSLSQPNPI